MALPAGTRLGPYEIVALLGAGGMGEVYRARDATLGRDAAIRVLPAQFANDPERVARFEREARTLAALSHPHIAQIYGFEHTGGTLALAMEFVEGEDLAERRAGRCRWTRRCRSRTRLPTILDFGLVGEALGLCGEGIVKFRPHQALDLLVPIEMREVFWSDAYQRKGTAMPSGCPIHGRLL